MKMLLAAAVIVSLAVAPAMATSYTSYGTVEAKLVGAPCWGSSTPGQVNGLNNGGVYEGGVCTGIYRLQVNMDTRSYSTGDAGQKLVEYAGKTGLLDTFCCDVWENAPSDYVPYTIIDAADAPMGEHAMGGTKAKDLARLMQKYYAGILPNPAWTNETAAAFQACVWEIVSETKTSTYGYDLSNGSFTEDNALSAGWLTTAQGWLNNLGNTEPDIKVYALGKEGAQDYAFFWAGGGYIPPHAVPEPLTILGLLGAVGSAVGYLRTRRAA
jgi:hypothetical protein